MSSDHMVRCPCCGITSGGGENPRTRYYDLLAKLARCATDNGDQSYMVDAAKEYLKNVTTTVSSGARPKLIPYEHDLENLQEAGRLIQKALNLEPPK